MRVDALFATPLVSLKLGDPAPTNRAILAAIAERRRTDAGRRRSNTRGWQSGDDVFAWTGDAGLRVLDACLSACARVTDDVGMREGRPRFAWEVQGWANVSPPGAGNDAHAHPGAYWSAVYYVDDGGGAAALTLEDPRFPLNRMVQPDFRLKAEGVLDATEVVIRPEPGKLVIFPSWLRHRVPAHEGPRERVSIAMNVLAVPVPPDALASEGTRPDRTLEERSP